MRQDVDRALESYRVLGLKVGTPQAEIRRAYRHLMKSWHPDVCAESLAEQRARSINRAFEHLKSLSPEELRRVTRSRRRAPQSRRPPRSTSSVSEVVSPLKRRGQDIAGRARVSRLEILRGARWKFILPTCHQCAGWGAAPGQAFEPCGECHGLGIDLLGGGTHGPPRPCGACHGVGCRFERPCPDCRGSGASTVYEARLALPSHSELGWSVVRGLGHPGLGTARAGDLYVQVFEGG